LPPKSNEIYGNTGTIISTANINIIDKNLSQEKKTNQIDNVNRNLINQFHEAAIKIDHSKSIDVEIENFIESPKRENTEGKKVLKEISKSPIREDKFFSISKVSGKENCDFTFKKSNIDEKSEFQTNKNSSSNIEIIDYQNNRDSFKLSIASESGQVDKVEYLNTITNGNKIENEKNQITSNHPISEFTASQISKQTPHSQVILPKIKADPFNSSEENIVEDEFEVNEDNHSNVDRQSIISSKILSHVNNPKMFGGIRSELDQSVNYSLSRVETQNNILITESNTQLPHLILGQDDTEFEITNENSERFEKFIETPKSSNINFSSTQKYSSTPYLNLHLKDLNDKISRKERETKKVHEKIQKIVNDLHSLDEENKRYERKIEKEEAEGEMLRHMLNFLMTKA
jgi:hypothetical protein